MPRGKNYVNNNKGVSLQAIVKSKPTMKFCDYGAGCTRADCIYRHGVNGKREEVCLPFLAGKCTFKDDGCRKRHPKKEEKARLIAKYKRTRCRFGNECYTEGCLYLHPREVQTMEPNYIEPHHVAFPPLNGAEQPANPKTTTNSVWKGTPAPVAPMAISFMPPHAPIDHLPPTTWPPMEAPMYSPNFSLPYFDPTVQGYPVGYYGGPIQPQSVPPLVNFNAEAKEFVPGNPMA